MLDRQNAEWDERVTEYIMSNLARDPEELEAEKEADASDAQPAAGAGTDGVAPMDQVQSACLAAHHSTLFSTLSWSQSASSDSPDTLPFWSIEQMQAYIYYVKANFRPALTPFSERILISYYQLQRQVRTAPFMFTLKMLHVVDLSM